MTELTKELTLIQKATILSEAWRKAVEDYRVLLWGGSSGRNGGLRGFVQTLDEHEGQASPVKPFPDRPHLRFLADFWWNNATVLVFKSRQLMVSWLFCALILWDCLKPGRRWLVACKKFEGAEALLERMWLIYNHLPEALRPKAERKQGFITIFHEGVKSIIQAASQTSEDPRQHTFSGVWIDEGEFTDNAPDLHTAMMPTIMAGGKFIMTTTPNGRGYFYQVASDGGRVKF